MKNIAIAYSQPTSNSRFRLERHSTDRFGENSNRTATAPNDFLRGKSLSPEPNASLPADIVAQAMQTPALNSLLPVAVGVSDDLSGVFRAPVDPDCAILIYGSGARGWCELAGQRYSICAGDILVVPPKTAYVVGSERGHSWKFSWVRVMGKNLDFFLNELGISRECPVVNLRNAAQPPALFEGMLSAIQNDCSLAHLLDASQILAQLFSLMLCHRHEQSRAEGGTDRKIEQSITYMKRNLGRPLRVSMLARLANISLPHYFALFKQRTGNTPMDFFIRLRMQRACQLLEATSLSVKEVAAELGYDDPFYFSRMFKSVNAVAPTEYRMTWQRRGESNPMEREKYVHAA
jgi:AraC-like DNA-binding protein